MTSRTIPLEQIKFGQEHEPPLNVRKVGRDADIQGLAASIKAHGLGQALNIHEDDQGIFACDGNRRLAALRLLRERGDLPDGYEVRCETGDGAADSDELSLALNIERVEMHEADAYEKFYELHHGRGMTAGRIASRFGIEKKRVNRILALGRLSPVILDWWREQDADRQTQDVVRAFTLAPSVEDQERVFKKLKKANALYGHTVRREFGAENRYGQNNLKFIGKKAYLAAGGSLIEDLFGDQHAVGDPALVARLAGEKLQAEADALIKDGWSWAAPASELPENAKWSWGRSHSASAGSSKEEKAKSGCIVSVDHEGRLDVRYGVRNPEQEKAEKRTAASKEPKAASISNALRHRLSVAMTVAVQNALPASPRVALAALVAGLECGYTDNSPVRVRKDGFGDYAPVRDAEAFADVFGRLVEMKEDALLAAAAHAMSKTIDLQDAYSAPSEGTLRNRGKLLDALDAEALQGGITRDFRREGLLLVCRQALRSGRDQGGSQRGRGAQGRQDEERGAGRLCGHECRRDRLAAARAPHVILSRPWQRSGIGGASGGGGIGRGSAF